MSSRSGRAITNHARTPERRAYEAKWRREKRAKNPEAALAYDRQYYAAHREYFRKKEAEYAARPEIKDAAKAYRKANAEKIKAYKAAWHKAHPPSPEKLAAHLCWRRETGWDMKRYFERWNADPFWKLKVSLRNRLRSAIKNGSKKGSAVKLLGCSVDFLKGYLEAQFQPGMTWDNWTLRGWHIDHKKPLTAFDLEDQVQLAEACHYTNLQPLWAADNIRKGNKLCVS